MMVSSDYVSDILISVSGRALEVKLKSVQLGSDTLLIGKSLKDINEFKYLMVRASFIAIILGGLFIWLSAYWFRVDLDSSVSVIRKTAQQIRSEKLKMRIPVEDVDDELNLLIKELNLMLDYLERSLAGCVTCLTRLLIIFVLPLPVLRRICIRCVPIQRCLSLAV